MKKVLLLFFGLFLFGFNCYSSGIQDEKSKIWRSTEVCGSLAEASISTVSAYAYMLQVTSGSTSVSQFQYVNSTGSVFSGAAASTSTVYDVDTTGDKWEIRRGLSGFRYTKTGGSCISILWDYLGSSPPGLEAVGLGRR